MEKNRRSAPISRNQSEAILARIAATFPDLLDPDCERALTLHTDPEELVEWLEKEFENIKQMETKGAKRVYTLLLDRARYGTPEKKEA